MFLWKKVWAEDARGIFLSVQILFEGIKRAWKGFIAFAQGKSISEELYRQLESAGLIGFVVALVQIKTRLGEIWVGFKDGIKVGIKPLLFGLELIGRAIGWVIDIFSRLMTWFTGSDLRESIALWNTLGYVLGFVAAVWLTKLTVIAIIWTAKLIPALVWGLLKLSLRFLFLGTRMLWFANVAMYAVIRSTLRYIRVLVVAGARMLVLAGFHMKRMIMAMGAYVVRTAAAAGITAILALKILLVVAAVIAYIWVFSKAIKKGEEWGPMIYEFVESLTTSLFNFWSTMKKWGGKIGTVFVEAFKGNFDPFFKYLEDSWDLAKKILGWFTSETTTAEIRDAAAKIGIAGATETEKKENVAGAAALLRGADVGTAMQTAGTADRVSAKIAKRNETLTQYSQLLAALQKQGRSVHVEKIELATQGMSPEESLRLAKDMLKKLSEIGDNEAEVEFAQ
jgi:hypothetical protein